VSNSGKLEKRIGYSFQEPKLLEQALTHRSYSNRNNERLEFLGDSILNFVVTAALYEKFPEASEGDLSRLRAGQVKQSTLAGVARELELGDQLMMGSGERKSGGFERASILSDTLEAVFGAVLLDGGLDAAIQCIQSLFESRINSLDLSALQKDPKSQLQEYLQGIGEPVPEYEVVSIQGKSPSQEFEVECRAAKLEKPLRARGTSKRRAEQNVAARVLEALGVVK
jgi:ribonuclease-3